MPRSFKIMSLLAGCFLSLSSPAYGQTDVQTRISSLKGGEHAPTTDSELQIASFAPQAFLDFASTHRNVDGEPLAIEIQYTGADLDGTGRFDFIVASFEVGLLGTVEVFRVSQGKLALAGQLEGNPNLGGGRMEIELVDVEDNGKPEVAVRSYGASDSYKLGIFQWTGISLRLLNPDSSAQPNTFGGAALFDVDNDGVLELITPCAASWVTDPSKPPLKDTPFGVYKFDGTAFKLAFTSPTDPTGQISPDGHNQSVFGDARMKSAHFQLAQIHEAAEGILPEKGDGNEGRLLVQLGNLSAPADANPGPRSVNDLDLKSLILGRTIRPLRARIVSADDDAEEQVSSAEHDGEPNGPKPARLRGPFVEANFSRQAVLRFLPRTQLSKALAPGDAVSIDVRGKMKNGAPVFGSVSVKIVGEDEGKHHDKN
jgi:hypothetical protein